MDEDVSKPAQLKETRSRDPVKGKTTKVSATPTTASKVSTKVNNSFFKGIKTAPQASRPVAVRKTSDPSQPVPVPPQTPAQSVVGRLIQPESRKAPPIIAAPLPPPPKAKKRRSVTWKPDSELEQINIIENISLKYADDLFIRPPSDASARSMDINEAAALKDKERDELGPELDCELQWTVPAALDFTRIDLDQQERGPKRAGSLKIDSADREEQIERESTNLLVHYAKDEDIPPSPNEPMPQALERNSSVPKYKNILLPSTLKVCIHLIIVNIC